MSWRLVVGGVAAIGAAGGGCKGKVEREPAKEVRPRVEVEAPAPTVDAAPRCVGARTCVGNDLVACVGGELGAVERTCRDGCAAGACLDTCAAQGVELIYGVDERQRLHSFNPRAVPGEEFREVGQVACAGGEWPFSMAVDRRGVAWVLYDGGSLHRVSIVDGRCLGSVATLPGVPRRFGMGFVSDGPGAETERLYASGHDEPRELGWMDTNVVPLRWQRLGAQPRGAARNAELTGTGDGKVYAYTPGAVGAGRVQQIDRDTGALVGRPLVVDRTSENELVRSWAVAHWGGSFYVFVTLGSDSRVYEVDGKSGTSRLVRSELPMRIVGAGVSTCAPLLEQVP
ncbi:MAG: hypothetical protein KA297_27205 [Kofleriaceae bacterium]|nr:hypothetical protein [Kofleriaceae bacterium]MBP6836895.1 hypothetical protein [Kofleriaceae bacterium]